jgi:hypothetical protein
MKEIQGNPREYSEIPGEYGGIQRNLGEYRMRKDVLIRGNGIRLK